MESANIWLFQANPEIFDLASDLENSRVGDEGTWDVTRQKDEMKAGDTVIFWMSGKHAGVYALGELTGRPYGKKGETVVPFRYTHILENPIPRDTIKAHPILGRMHVIRSPVGTNFRVTEEEWTFLQRLMSMESPGNQVRIWKISAGEGGRYWEDFQEAELMGIEFNEYWQGPLRHFDSRDDLLKAINPDKHPPHRSYVADQLWYIYQEMNEGDIVFAYGSGALRGKGYISGPYKFEEESSFPYPHQRPVIWDDAFTPLSRTNFSPALRRKLKKQETIVPLTYDEYEEIMRKLREQLNGEDVVLRDALTGYFASKGYRFSSELLATFVTALQTKGFVILSGLSGTGKTKLAQHLAALLPKPEDGAKPVEETTEEGDILIQVQPYMLKYARIIVPKSAWGLLDVPPEGETIEIWVNFEGQSQQCRLVHASYTGSYLQLLLRGQARKWFVENFKEGEALILQPQTSEEENEFIGFDMVKPEAVSTARKVPLPNHIFVAVRPDWRDSKSLLGYYNPLTGAYDDTAFLQFVLQAKSHFDKTGSLALPHFVILDEMNLARVEYYFADFLSVLESGRDEETGYSREAIVLHNRNPYETLDSRGQPIPQRINLPPNLYIIGTVNMDETTHAFSPKVLDRAFTIEFNQVDLEGYLSSEPPSFDMTQKEELQQVLLTDFQREGKFAQIDKDEVLEIIQQEELEYQYQLHVLNEALSQFDLHFGYRVFDEIAQFIAVADRSDLFDELNSAFDVAVLMKVLPKFNGPRSRLRRPLQVVVAWAKNPNLPDDKSLSGQLKDAEACRSQIQNLPGEFVYPQTARKALRMLTRLYETGFASFA